MIHIISSSLFFCLLINCITKNIIFDIGQREDESILSFFMGGRGIDRLLVFMRFRKTLPFPPLLIFLLPILYHIAFCDFVLYLVICKAVMKENTVFKQNIVKNLEKRQFWPHCAGTLRSQKIKISSHIF